MGWFPVEQKDGDGMCGRGVVGINRTFMLLSLARCWRGRCDMRHERGSFFKSGTEGLSCVRGVCRAKMPSGSCVRQYTYLAGRMLACRWAVAVSVLLFLWKVRLSAPQTSGGVCGAGHGGVYASSPHRVCTTAGSLYMFFRSGREVAATSQQVYIGRGGRNSREL